MLKGASKVGTIDSGQQWKNRINGKKDKNNRTNPMNHHPKSAYKTLSITTKRRRETHL
jgi:hypothetical protein